MQKPWLPQPLYQLLPLVYLLFGLLMLARFSDDLLGLLSGLMLCAASILVWILRKYAAATPPSESD